MIASALAVVACAPAALTKGEGATVNVVAMGETQPVGTADADAADDPAIWRNPRNPEASWIVATDKKAGLHVYGLDGKSRHFVAAGRVNNVDLVDLGRRGILVVASDRNDESAAVLLLYQLDKRSGQLVEIGRVPGGAGEAYGVCLFATPRAVYAFSVLKQGLIQQVKLDLDRPVARGAIVRTMTLKTQTEGCVVDPRTNTLFVGEEDVGIWRFDAREAASVDGRLVAPIDGKHLVADVEGLAISPQGKRGGYLVASSQGDNAYALYRLPDLAPVGRFRIAAGAFGSAEETDGIALALGSFGRAYPRGLFVAQDGENAPNAQNFKLVPWKNIEKAFRDLGAVSD
jgi:3-phytase